MHNIIMIIASLSYLHSDLSACVHFQDTELKDAVLNALLNRTKYLESWHWLDDKKVHLTWPPMELSSDFHEKTNCLGVKNMCKMIMIPQQHAVDYTHAIHCETGIIKSCCKTDCQLLSTAWCVCIWLKVTSKNIFELKGIFQLSHVNVEEWSYANVNVPTEQHL